MPIRKIIKKSNSKNLKNKKAKKNLIEAKDKKLKEVELQPPKQF
jgi:hypothetical protein